MQRINIQVIKHEVLAITVVQMMHLFHCLPLPPFSLQASALILCYLLPQPHSVSIYSDPVSTVMSPCSKAACGIHDEKLANLQAGNAHPCEVELVLLI